MHIPGKLVLLSGFFGLCFFITGIVVASSAVAQEIRFEWPGATNKMISKVTPGKGRCVIVSEGKPRARIIIASNPTRAAQVAALELQHYVEKMSGAKLLITTDAMSATADPKILVGESLWTKALGLSAEALAPQEYIIRNYGDILVLMGRDEQEFGIVDYEGTGLWPEFGTRNQAQKEAFKKIGSLYAADEFLQRNCGIRWYLPGDLGEVCPKKVAIAATDMNLQLKPWTEYRWIYPPGNMADYFNFPGARKPLKNMQDVHGWRDTNLWLARLKIVGTKPYISNHTLGSGIWEKRFAGDPATWEEIRAKGDIKDARMAVHGGQLCLSSDKLVDILVQDAKDYATGKPDNFNTIAKGDCFPVMPNDLEAWCKCERCAKLVHPEATTPFPNHTGVASELVWGLVNKVAKRLRTEAPSLRVTCNAYWDYLLPPSFDLEPNVAVMMSRLLPYEITKPGMKEFYRQTLTEWSKRSKGGFYLWEYFCEVQNNNELVVHFPGIFLNVLEDDTRFLRSIGLKGNFNELSMYGPVGIPNFALDHLNFYAWARLMSQDVNEDMKTADLLEDYCKSFYGPAAAPMKKFFELAQERYTNPEFRKLQVDQINVDWEGVCPPSVLPQFRDYLNEADKLAPEGNYATRVQLIREAVYNRFEEECRAFNDPKAANQAILDKKVMEISKTPEGELPFGSKSVQTGEFLSLKGEAVPVATSARLSRDAKNIYIQVICSEKEMGKLKRREQPAKDGSLSANIWADDTVELFFDVGRKRSGEYVQIAVNPNGAVFAKKQTSGGVIPGVKAAISEKADSWTVDLTVPLSSLTAKTPAAGELWGLNIGRTRMAGGKGESSCWSPTMSGRFAETKKFGKLIFKD